MTSLGKDVIFMIAPQFLFLLPLDRKAGKRVGLSDCLLLLFVL